MKGKILIWTIALILFCSSAFAITTDGLISYWSFDSGDRNSSHAYDLEGGHHATAHGNNYTTGILGTGANFTGTAPGNVGGYMEVENSNNLYEGYPHMTVCVWVNTSVDEDAWQFVPMSKYYDGATRGWMLYESSSNSDSYKMLIATNTQDDNDGPVAEPYTLNTWEFYCGVWNTTGFIYIYKNGVLNGTQAQAGATVRNNNINLNFGRSGGGIVNNRLTGTIDEASIWNRSLTPSDINDLYNGGAGYNPLAGGGPTGTNFTITNYDFWNGTQILNFSADINGTIYHSNSSGVIDVNFTYNNTADLDILIYNSTDYLNRSYTGYNPNSSGTLTAYTYQAILCLNASAKVSGAGVTPDSFTIGTNTSTECFNISAGTYNVKASLTGWFDKNQTFTVTALSNTTQTLVNMSYANLTIYAIDGTTNESLSNYNLSIESLNWTWTGESATGVTNHSFYLVNGTYNVTIAMPGYAVTYSQANVTVAGDTNHTFVLYLANSVSITIRDEITNNIITDNVTIRWSDNATTWENVTNTSSLFVSNITAGNYTLLFYSSNYSTRTYTLTVGASSHQFLTAYMISSTYSTIFTIKDIDTGSLLDGVAITMYKLINSSWTTVESKVSDISGKAQFYYDPIANYRFYLSNAEYDDYVFYLNPILFSTYDVYMTKTSVLNYSVDFDDISFIYSPTTFTNDVNTSMNFLISSPSGMLTDYGIKVTYPGGTDSDSGVNAIGEQLTVDVNITNATAFDYVVLEFNYTTSLAGTRSYTFNLPINMNITAGTWLSSKDKTYGMGIFERMLIATIIIIFVVGIATMVGQALPGIALGLFVYGFLVFIGFVPLWAILPSMLVGVLFLIWKSGGY